MNYFILYYYNYLNSCKIKLEKGLIDYLSYNTFFRYEKKKNKFKILNLF